MKALVMPDDMERVREMLRDKVLLDWLDQCAGEIRLKNGVISLYFGGGNVRCAKFLDRRIRK
jgi:hypothetical protein